MANAFADYVYGIYGMREIEASRGIDFDIVRYIRGILAEAIFPHLMGIILL